MRAAAPRPARPRTSRAPKIAIEIAVPSARWRRALPKVEEHAEIAARAALVGVKLPRAKMLELSLVLGDDSLVRRLNRRWRGKDRPTNVLSFASDEDVADGRALLLGDVVLAYETVAREAAAQGKSLAAHLAHLVAHGVLHLLGFDHQEDDEAERMERRERRVLARLGIADPYREQSNG
jgi:probable rRNA maturation factor